MYKIGLVIFIIQCYITHRIKSSLFVNYSGRFLKVLKYNVQFQPLNNILIRKIFYKIFRIHVEIPSRSEIIFK